MMIHDSIIPGQFLFNLKNEHNMLHAPAAFHTRHQHTRHQREYHPYHLQAQQALQTHPLQQQVPLQTLEKIELYSVYAQQQHQQILLQQQQQQLLGERDTRCLQQQSLQRSAVASVTAAAEVLDLSRRCDSVETTRKTPSPTLRRYNSDSNFSVDSPTASPLSSTQQSQPKSLTQAQALVAAVAQEQQQQIVPANLLYSAQLPPPLASLYSGFCYPGNVKIEDVSTSTVTPPPATTPASVKTRVSSPALPTPLQVTTSAQDALMSTQLAVAAAAAAAANASGALLQKFNGSTTIPTIPSAVSTSSATSPSRTKVAQRHADDIVMPVSPNSSYDGGSKSPSAPSTPNSSSNATAGKSTRPFKAYPRDPLVIAANFAAGDMLLDNARIERYTEYRKRMLEQIRNSNGGTRTISNPKMRRTTARRDSNSSNNDDQLQANLSASALDVLDSSDCDSNAGHAERVSTTNANSDSNNNNNNSTNMFSACGGQIKDAAYYERRRKNNAAAKKSRDRRRIKEDEIAIRAAYLERQNIELLCQIDALKAQLATFTSKVC